MFVRVIFAPFVLCFVGMPGSVDDSPSQIVEGKHESPSGESATYTGVNDAKLGQIRTLPPQLKRLSFRNSELTDAGLVNLKDLVQLRFLSLNGAQIRGTGIVHFKRLSQLKSLSLNDTKLTDAGMEHLAELTQLSDAGPRQLRSH